MRIKIVAAEVGVAAAGGKDAEVEGEGVGGRCSAPRRRRLLLGRRCLLGRPPARLSWGGGGKGYAVMDQESGVDSTSYERFR